jgi:hypothetical protein
VGPRTFLELMSLPEIEPRFPGCPDRTSVTVLTEILGRVSKYVTDGSKTTVIDVIGSLCISLGSSTIQFHDSLGSR